MKNKKIILNLLLSFVMVFVIGFGFSVKANVNKAHAINGYEVEFVNGTSKYVATINSETTYADIVNGIKNQNNLSSNDTITFYFYYKNPDTELQMIDKNQFDYNNAKVLDVFNFYGAGPNNYDNYYFHYEVVTASPSNDPDPTPGPFNVNFNSISNEYSNYEATITENTKFSDIVSAIKNANSNITSQNTITFYFYEIGLDEVLVTIDEENYNENVLTVFEGCLYDYDYYYFTYKVVTASPSTVTWTQDDIVSDNLVNDYTFSKDGVTLTAEMLNLEYKFIAEGTFSTTLGNFTKIEVTGSNGIEGTGWSGDENGIIWTGEPASSVSFSGGINGYNGVTIVFTIEPAEEQQSQKVITFRPVVEGERVYENTAPSEVVVKYYVTYNDGVNSFVLVPSYDKNVFTLLDSNKNPRVQVSGIATEAITVTGNVKGENDPEFVKIAFDSSTPYSAAHEYEAESESNVLVLTLTFTVHTAPANYGHYRGFFGLVLDDNGKTNNTSSVAYQDLSGEELGNQEEVLINLDVDNPNEVAVPENVVDFYKRNVSTFEVYSNNVVSTYCKTAMPVTKVTNDYNTNLGYYGVQFKYNGNGTPVITWKEGETILPSAPQNVGTYTVTISIPATDTYTAVEPVTIPVTINPALVTVTINNQSKVYGENAITFAGNFGVKVPSGYYTVSGSVYGTDNITFNLTSGVVRTSNAGSYPISKTHLSVSDDNNGNNYGVDIIDGTYTVSKYIIKIYYGFEQTTFNGGTKTAYSLTGTPNIKTNDYYTLPEDISGLLGTVNVTYSIALPEGVVPANNPEYEDDYYTVTPLYAFVKQGSANNFEVTTIQSGYKINPAHVTLKAGDAEASYNGGTKTAYDAPTTYYVYAGSSTTPVSEALRTALGTVTLTVNFPEGVVSVGNYTIIPSYTANSNFVVTTSNGTYAINTADLTDEEKAAIYAAFGIVEVTYDAQGHQMYTFDGSGLPLGLTANDLGTRYSYLAKINDETATDRISAGEYPVTVTFTINDPTINQNRNSTYGTENYQPISLTFVVKKVEDNVTKYSSISQKAVTITADDKRHTYGSTPATLTPVTVGINGEVNVIFTVKNNNSEAITLSQTTPAGTYTIVPSATNANYAFTFVNGTYTVSKATPVLEIDAMTTFYNDHLYIYWPSIRVGNLVLNVNGHTHDPEENPYGFNYAIEIWKGNQKVLDDAWISENYWLDAGNDYTAKLVLTGNDNYYSASASSETFEIMKVYVGGPNTDPEKGEIIEYNGNTVTWPEVTTDVDGKDLHNSTVTYTISGTEYANRSFTATAKGTYRLTITTSNTNYEATSFYLDPVYSVKFLEGTHTANPATPTNMPAEQLLFKDQYATQPATNPSLTGYTFAGWNCYGWEFNFNEYNIHEGMVDENGDCYLTAQWNIVNYTVTFKYTEDGEAHNFSLPYNSTIAYAGLNLIPEKSSTDGGIYYTYNGEWVSNNVTYTVNNDGNLESNSAVYHVTGEATFVAQYTTNYISFTITYYVKENGGNYVEQEYKTVVAYNSVIEYRELETDVHWFTTSAWFADEGRTETAPTTMPNHNINVYGAVVFNVGLGDVNGDGYVNANDITLYRQWIVGGYEMTVVEAGTEWETATAPNFDANGKYYLARVADNNADTSKDIRDVSITRMSIVGGYTWEVKTGLNVTGQEISRNNSEKILINDLEGLKSFRDAVNAGDNYAGKIILLNADVTLDEAWTPISNYSRKDSANESKWFAGIFDGNGHTISGLTNDGLTTGNITEMEEYTYGLFGCAKNAIIRNLNLTNVNISADNGDSLGALVGYYFGNEMKTNISNITVSGSVVGADNVGGVIGRAAGTYFKVNNVTVSGTVSANYKASGVVGTGNAKEMVFENCTNNAEVSSTVSNSNAGYNAVAGISITWQSACQKVVMTGCSNNGAISSVNENAIVGQLAVDYSPKTQLDANGTWTYASGHWTLAN